MDPIALTVSAIALGAKAGLKDTAKKVVSDAYDGVKRLIQRKFQSVDLNLIEQDPQSKRQRAVIEEDLLAAGADKDEELLQLVSELILIVETHAPSAAQAVGIILEDAKAASIRISNVIASGTGIQARKVEASGDIQITGVRAGQTGDSGANPH